MLYMIEFHCYCIDVMLTELHLFYIDQVFWGEQDHHKALSDYQRGRPSYGDKDAHCHH